MARKYVSLSKLSTFLDNLKNTFAAISHKHKLSDITDYIVDSALSPISTNPIQNNVVDAEFEAVSNAMNALDSAINEKADVDHNHNDIYYTKTEIDTFEFITTNDIDFICDETYTEEPNDYGTTVTIKSFIEQANEYGTTAII